LRQRRNDRTQASDVGTGFLNIFADAGADFDQVVAWSGRASTIAEIAGLREYTTFLSGTAANPEAGLRWSSFLGMVYIVLYLGFVVVAPILILAAGLLAVGKRMK